MKNLDQENKAHPFLFSCRFLLAIMAFLGYCLQYMLKINLGIAIVCMVNHTALQMETPNTNLFHNASIASISNNTLGNTDSLKCVAQIKHQSSQVQLSNSINHFKTIAIAFTCS
jgi:hypothetical protein